MDSKIAKRRDFLINAAYIAAVAFIVFLCYKYLLSYIMPFVVAFILVSIVNPIIRKIQSKFPKSRSIVSFIIMFLLYLIIATLLVVLVANLYFYLIKIANLIANDYYPNFIKPGLIGLWNSFSDFITTLPPEWQKTIIEAQNNIMSSLQSFVVGLAPRLMSSVTRITGSVPGMFIAFLFTIMLSFFVSMRYDQVVGFFNRQLSDKTKNVISEMKAIIKNTVGLYVRAMLILMFITFVELVIGLKILGVSHFILIAAGIAILDALPVFGTGTILIPWTIIKLINGEYQLAFGLFILYIVITLVRQLLEPRVVGTSLGINPIVSIVSIYFGFKTLGVIGMIAMPMIVQIIIELNNRGAIHLFKTSKTEAAAAIAGGGTADTNSLKDESKKDKKN